jgi:hypothetical protein
MTSETVCELLHHGIWKLPRYRIEEIHCMPSNGDRIVRIGSHTGEGNLSSRLREHMTQNKDRSIFRKHVGRALLARDSDPYLAVWNLDFTSRKLRESKGHLVNALKQAAIEDAVSDYISRFSVSVLPMRSPEEACRLERLCIRTAHSCGLCGPSPHWLGMFADTRIARSGLWQVMHLKRNGLKPDELRSTEESLRVHLHA